MKTRLLLSFFALLFAGGVLFVSLSSGTLSTVAAGSHSATESRLYFGEEIDPDHVFYSVVMVIDRVKLETASDQERIFIQVEYAHRRLESAQNLLSKGEEDLAMTTLTKGEKYLHHAVMETQRQDAPISVKERVRKAIEYHTKALAQIKSELRVDADRAVIDQILKEHEALSQSLK